MRVRSVLAGIVVAGCSGGGGGDAATDAASDGAVDARPPNTTRLGLVQAVRFASGSGAVSSGFYEVPVGQPGCTWTYDGACVLSICPPDAGLIAVTAGTLTLTIDSVPTTVMPDEMSRYPYTSPVTNPPGSTIVVSAEGGAVGAFASGTLVVPEPLLVGAPDDDATISQSQALALTWQAAAGATYVNLSQLSTAAPYPSSYHRTIRCALSSQDGGGMVPASLIGQLVAGGDAVTLTVAAMDTETFDVGDYEVTVRAIAVDMVRRLFVQ